MGYRRIPLNLLLFIFFSVFIFINLRWFTYSKTICKTKPMIISETLRDTQSRVVVSTGLFLVALFTLMTFYPITIDVILISLTTLSFSCAFIFYEKIVHEIFVGLAITFAIVVTIRTKKSFVSSRLYLLFIFLTLVTFITLYIVDRQTCTYNGFVEYVLITQIFLALFINRYHYINRGYTHRLRTF